MSKQTWVLRGDICYSTAPDKLETVAGGYLVSVDGVCQGVFPQLPEAYAHLPLHDWSGHLVMPGLTDLHVHAPQYPFRGLSMDLELLDWLNTHTFPEESKYVDVDYAQRSYAHFVQGLQHSPNTRACIFATLHTPATLALMDALEASGLETMVGRVNMDRNCPDYLREVDAETALRDTEAWLQACQRYQRTQPILTPRFIPTCSDELMAGLGQLQRKYKLPVQSHLSENQGEIAWVAELCPEADGYADAYDTHGLLGRDAPTIMAHCVLSDEKEQALLAKNGVFVAHCPQSNANVSSGIAPIQQMLAGGVKVGLGSDVAAGVHLFIFRAMTDAVLVSKLRWRLVDQTWPALTLTQAFWMATVGGGSFFGKVGTFLPDYQCDVVVIDDRDADTTLELTIAERLERAAYLSDDRHIKAKFVSGRAIFE